MSQSNSRRCHPRKEAGFALILALLALMLLTMLGLTLATTTSSELQIATNYRYSQQAYYNAEAGIEIGKRYLRQTDWRAILPLPRTYEDIFVDDPPKRPTPYQNRPGPEGEPSRNLELASCDEYGEAGYGAVLDDPTQPFPFQNSSNALGETLNGTFTLWVRRPITVNNATKKLEDDPNDTRLILTAEGTAPYAQGWATGQYQAGNRAVRYLEVTLSREEEGCSPDRAEQAGGGPTGSGFDECNELAIRGTAAQDEAK